MKRLRSRLFMHFSIQFISIAILMVVVIIITLLITVGLFTKSQSEHHYYQTKLEEITFKAGNSFKELTMDKDWDKGLEEEKLWVQIINHKGEVVESGNVPLHFPDRYSMLDLLNMKETKEYKGYSLTFYLETFYETDYLFVLGYEEKERIFLQELVQTYNHNGIINEEDVPNVKEKLQKIGGSLEIYNNNNVLKQSVGATEHKEDLPIDIFLREVSPDIFSNKQLIFRDLETGALWVLYTPNAKKQELTLHTYQEVLIAAVITGAVVLFITIIISAWNGFRYGHPLFIFSNWLTRMGNGQYEEVLTEREKKHIYRKSGKLKWRYRLYKEVFHAFYEMAERLDASRKEREQLEKTREEWMAGISHDLRTPLTTMEGYGRLLESGEYDWSKQELKDIGKTIYDKSDYMLNLIEDFTLSFKLKNKSAFVSFNDVEINEFMKGILKKFTNDITLQNYLISVEPLAQQKFVKINERLFERMIDNLIYNAIQHNPAGTSITISIKKMKGSNGFRLVVKDNGVGMDEETKKHLFSRYYRGTNTDERIEGTGLGMSIALQIAKLHQGSISVKSAKKMGTRVTVVFPEECIEKESNVNG